MARKRRRVKRRRTHAPRMSFGELFFLHKSLFIIGAIILIVLIAAISALSYFAHNYTITNVYVDGNVHYTDEEIMNMVMTDKLDRNSMYLSLKYRDKEITGVPFIEKMDVEILSPDTIRINVYEKAIAGYVKYLDRYIFFDRDGIVVETSEQPSDDVPLVLGLSFDYIVLHEKLPVENENVFKEVLDITQLLNKYDLKADKIFFDSDFHLYIYFDEVEVSLGTNDNIDEKVIQLQYILPELQGKSGILEMSEYDSNTQNITFEQKN
ncbi:MULTISPECIES: cell division protein FtsQ/DivIB [unclassified Butyrivibrio]|uniref:cell division protein FtsQ/DivIB n=1 Tax=unclassified Butyrivibrio TaxID=2639466 RepID=UPI0003B5EFBB|nr:MULTISPECIES: FtsQ-type POTRA domain-containing protein [unclassified Butyrivibrio]SDB34441.1 cell division protein FtsQ [Butyrivibrio sp. INlla16]SEM08950.1 cell division protein FtsQ [Butyrivibrio sp. ob235]